MTSKCCPNCAKPLPEIQVQTVEEAAVLRSAYEFRRARHAADLGRPYSEKVGRGSHQATSPLDFDQQVTEKLTVEQGT